MRVLRAVFLAAFAATPLFAQQFRVGVETPITEPRIGRAGGFKTFGGLATDGEHALAVWGRGNSFESLLDGKVRNTAPALGAPLGLVWSGEAYFLLSRPDRVLLASRDRAQRRCDLRRGESPAIAMPPATISVARTHLVIWREAWPDRTLTLMSRIDWRGRLLDEEPLELATTKPRVPNGWLDASEVAAATDGRELFVVWTGDDGVAGVRVGFDGRVRDKTPIDLRDNSGSHLETLVSRARLELGVTDVDVVPTRDGWLAIFSETGQRVTANLFDRKRHLYATAVVAEDKTLSGGELIPQLQRAHVALAGGHAFVVYMHHIEAEQRTGVFVRQLDATRE